MVITGTIRKYRQYEIMKVKEGWKIVKFDSVKTTLQEAMDCIDNYEDSKQIII
jgi:hypothetical protein